MSTGKWRRDLQMTPDKLRIAQRLDRIHKRTSHKAIAHRLGVGLSNLRRALYQAKK